MINIPTETLSQYSSILAKKSIPISSQYYYKMWVRYYLDFCHKYGFSHSNRESLVQFIKKLQEKHQPQSQQNQAAQAVSLYYELLQSGVNADTGRNTVLDAKSQPRPETTLKILGMVQNYSPQGYRDTEKNNPLTPFSKGELEKYSHPLAHSVCYPDLNHAEILPLSPMQVQEEPRVKEDSVVEQWKKTYADMSAEIKIRHYSPRTLEIYTMWLRKFHGFTKNKSPFLLSSADVKEFLKYLAVRQNVSASTQNQAFNALLFLFRYVLKKDFGDYKDCVRAKKRPYIPVVLSRDEMI